MGITG